MRPTDLTPREGKTLRFIAGRTTDDKYALPTTDECIVETVWSDLPHTHLEALATVASLKASKLVVRSGDGWKATQAGIKLIATANKSKVWQQAPPPNITNPKLRA